MAYIAQVDLENALGKPIVESIFDDDLDGIADVAAVTACCDYATAECDSILRALGPANLTLPVAAPSNQLKFLALDFAIAYAMRRRPDLVRALVGDKKTWFDFYESATKRTESYAKEHARFGSDVGPAQTASALPDVAQPPPGALAASPIAFDSDGPCCLNNDWIRREGCH